MFRRLCLLFAALAMLLAGLAVVPSLTAVASAPTSPVPTAADGRADKADKWVPASGAAFNIPKGSVKKRTKLITRVKAGINHAPKGSTIRFAMYSFDRRDVANALLKAHQRGVNIQLIVNDNWTSAQTVRLRRELGTKPKRKNFYVICHGSCRGGKGNLHMKVYAFSQTGAAKKVLMTGSSNLTNRAVSLQWNDQITFLNSPDLYDMYLKVFKQLKKDKRVSPRRMTYAGNDSLDAIFYRPSATADSTVNSTLQPRKPTPNEDPVMKRLKAVNCKSEPGYGVNGHTKIRIMMYAWMRDRSYLADRVAYLKRKGCDIVVITSVSSSKVVSKLRRAGIPVKSADYDIRTDADGERVVNFYSHLKVMMLNGTYQGESVRTIWTGSENWSGISFLNDELILHVTSDSAYAKYIKHFNLLWKHHTHGPGR